MDTVNSGSLTYNEKRFIVETLQKHEERIQKLEDAIDKSYQMLDNSLHELKKLKDLLITNPQPAKEEGLYPWHRKD